MFVEIFMQDLKNVKMTHDIKNLTLSILYIKETTHFSTHLGWTFLSKNTLNFNYKQHM